MRNNLVLVLHCSRCLKPLEISYEEIPDKVKGLDSNPLTPPPGTGADIKTSRVMVSPCNYCITELTDPARQLIDAIYKLTLQEPAKP